jgi:hypothetical protein
MTRQQFLRRQRALTRLRDASDNPPPVKKKGESKEDFDRRKKVHEASAARRVAEIAVLESRVYAISRHWNPIAS